MREINERGGIKYDSDNSIGAYCLFWGLLAMLVRLLITFFSSFR